MEDPMRRRPIPSFGNWEYCEEVPITQYFESASHAGLLRGGAALGSGVHLYPPPLPHYYYYYQPHPHALDVDEDLFKVPAAPPVVVTTYPRKARKGATLEKQLKLQQQQPPQRNRSLQAREEVSQLPKKQGRVCDCNVTPRYPPRRAMAVDEDLYQIPPELLYEKPVGRRSLFSEFLSRCLGLSCIP